MIWSATFGGIPEPFVVFLALGCACDLMYLMICSAATPVSSASCTASRVSIPTYRFGSL